MRKIDYQPDFLLGTPVGSCAEPDGNLLYIFNQPTQVLFSFKMLEVVTQTKALKKTHIWQYRDEIWQAECLANPQDLDYFLLRKYEYQSWKILVNTFQIEDDYYNRDILRHFVRSLS